MSKVNDITVTMNMRATLPGSIEQDIYTPAKFSSIDELIAWLEKYKDTLICFTIHAGRTP